MILGDKIEDSGWCSTITEADKSSSGEAQSLSASLMSRLRYTHQVTSAFFHILMMKASESYINQYKHQPRSFVGMRKKRRNPYSFIIGHQY